MPLTESRSKFVTHDALPEFGTLFLTKSLQWTHKATAINLTASDLRVAMRPQFLAYARQPTMTTAAQRIDSLANRSQLAFQVRTAEFTDTEAMPLMDQRFGRTRLPRCGGVRSWSKFNRTSAKAAKPLEQA